MGDPTINGKSLSELISTVPLKINGEETANVRKYIEHGDTNKDGKIELKEATRLIDPTGDGRIDFEDVKH